MEKTQTAREKIRNFLTRLNIYKAPLISALFLGVAIIWLIASGKLILSGTVSLADLLSTVAIGITIFTFFIVRAQENERDRIRKKKAFGLIKLTVLRSLKSEVKTLIESIKGRYNTTNSQECILFLTQVSNFNIIAQGLHTDWIQNLYDPNFLDLIYNDEVFNGFSLLIQEMSIYRSTLYRLSANASQLLFLMKNWPTPSDPPIYQQCKKMEEQYIETANKVLKYIEDLESELSTLFKKMNVTELEVSR